MQGALSDHIMTTSMYTCGLGSASFCSFVFKDTDERCCLFGECQDYKTPVFVQRHYLTVDLSRAQALTHVLGSATRPEQVTKYVLGVSVHV